MFASLPLSGKPSNEQYHLMISVPIRIIRYGFDPRSKTLLFLSEFKINLMSYPVNLNNFER